MKLTKVALDRINTKEIRPLLALALRKSESTILRYIYNNEDDLTKAAAMQVIRKETGLKDSEILQADAVVNKAAGVVAAV